MSRPAALVVVLLLLVSACTTRTELKPGPPESSSGSPSSGGAPAGGPSPQGGATAHNDADLAYAHELGAMHQQAIDLVSMLGTKDSSPALRALAAEIGRSRSAELAELNRLLSAWGGTPHADFHGNPGELTRHEMEEIYALERAAFEQRWLAAMVANHRTAVAMSLAEVDRGRDLPARELARGLARTQREQLDELEALVSRS